MLYLYDIQLYIFWNGGKICKKLTLGIEQGSEVCPNDLVFKLKSILNLFLNPVSAIADIERNVYCRNKALRVG